ncbi:hypothetical protein COBT_000863 [Conglomerata obtusa]
MTIQTMVNEVTIYTKNNTYANNVNSFFNIDFEPNANIKEVSKLETSRKDLFRFRRSDDQVEDQNEDEIIEFINKIPNEENMTSMAANIEPYKKDDYAYATKLHNLITMFLPFLSDLSIIQIYKPSEENYAEIIRLRNMVALMGKLMAYRKEIKTVKNEIIQLHETFNPKEDSTTEFWISLSKLLTRRNSVNNDYNYHIILFKRLFELQKQITKANGIIIVDQ